MGSRIFLQHGATTEKKPKNDRKEKRKMLNKLIVLLSLFFAFLLIWLSEPQAGAVMMMGGGTPAAAGGPVTFFYGITSNQGADPQSEYIDPGDSAQHKMVLIGIVVASSITVTSVTYGGETCTLIDSYTAASATISFYYRWQPLTGIQELIIDYSGTPDGTAGIALLDGMAAASFGTAQKGIGTSISVNVPSGGMGFDIVGGTGALTLTPNSGVTQAYGATVKLWGMGGSYSTTTGSQSLGSWAGTEIHMGLPINP